MRLSSMTDYAVVTMCAAARQCGGAARTALGAERRARISAAELAREAGLPQPTVQKLVSLLVRARLLRSVRGAGGGLQLARPAAAISLADIVEAVEGPIGFTPGLDGPPQECAREAAGAVRPHWALVNATMRGALAEISLIQLSAPPPAGGVEAPRGPAATSREPAGALQ